MLVLVLAMTVSPYMVVDVGEGRTSLDSMTVKELRVSVEYKGEGRMLAGPS